jgi:ABC-type oligopeptide transport system ATPase subunit
MLLHAAAVVKDKKTFLFLGVSGSGKSTVAALSKKYKVLGDDIIAVRKIDKTYYAFPTPWKQMKMLAVNPSLKGKIQAIFFLKKSSRIFFRYLPPEETLSRILSSHIHFLIYTDKPFLKNLFATAVNFAKQIPAYEMEFTKNANFWQKLEKNTHDVR